MLLQVSDLLLLHIATFAARGILFYALCQGGSSPLSDADAMEQDILGLIFTSPEGLTC